MNTKQIVGLILGLILAVAITTAAPTNTVAAAMKSGVSVYTAKFVTNAPASTNTYEQKQWSNPNVRPLPVNQWPGAKEQFVPRQEIVPRAIPQKKRGAGLGIYLYPGFSLGYGYGYSYPSGYSYYSRSYYLTYSSYSGGYGRHHRHP